MEFGFKLVKIFDMAKQKLYLVYKAGRVLLRFGSKTVLEGSFLNKMVDILKSAADKVG